MSNKVKNAQEIDIEKYAQDILDSWDMETLMSFAYETLVEILDTTPQDQLVEEYNRFYDPKENNE